MEILRIKDAIKEKGYTVQEIADKLGYTRQTLYTHMVGNPSIEVLKKIADVLHVHITDLFAKPQDPEGRPAVTGFLKINDQIKEVTSIEDLHKIIDYLSNSK